jgi:hypothetical protein
VAELAFYEDPNTTTYVLVDRIEGPAVSGIDSIEYPAESPIVDLVGDAVTVAVHENFRRRSKIEVPIWM